MAFLGIEAVQRCQSQERTVREGGLLYKDFILLITLFMSSPEHTAISAILGSLKKTASDLRESF